MAKISKFGKQRGKLRNQAVYNPLIQVPVGYQDAMSNNRSFSTPASVLIDGNTVTPIMPGSFYTAYWPAEHVLDLHGVFLIDHIDLWDVGGGANYLIKSGMTMYGMTQDYSITLNQNTKRTFAMGNKQVRFISFTINHTKAEVQANPSLRNGASEVKVFGKAVSFDVIPPKVERPLRSFPELLGWNQDIFSDFNQNVYNNNKHNYPGTHFRIYDYPEKMMNATPFPNTKFAFSNGYIQGVNYDLYFQSSKAAGITVIPTMIGLCGPEGLYKPSYDAAGETYTSFLQPRQATASSTDPASYLYPAMFCFEFAKRYGYLATTPSSRIDSGRETQNLYGTGWCNRLEFGNELDNWFRDVRESFLPAEQAALISACVDGHCGTMGAGYGALTADPEFEMIMPAMADFSLDYIMCMYYWWKENRPDGSIPKLSINIHSYLTDGGGQFVFGAKCIAPELFYRAGYKAVGVRQYVDEFADKIKRYFPNTPIYWTEFGVDSNKYSIVGVDLPTQAEAALMPYPLNSWQQQAAWTIRTIFECMATTSIDYTTKFTLNNYSNTNERVERYSDVDDNPDTVGWNTGGYAADIQFNTSGDYIGQYGFTLGTTSSINVNVAVGTTIVLTLHDASTRPDFVWPTNIQLRDPADTAGNGAHLYTTYVSHTDTSLTVQVSNTGPGGVSYTGSGSFISWRLDTPFAKKLGYYVNKNCLAVLTIGQKLIRENSTSEYRHLVVGDATRESHIIWLPTNLGNQITRSVNFQRTSGCIYRNLESKTGAEAAFPLTGTGASVVINEMPKIFYFNL
jgi:hypothetical protein